MASVTGYVREQAQRHDFNEIARRLHASLDLVGQHLNGLRQDQADFKPSSSEWSLGEILRHVTDAVRGMVHIADKLHRSQEFKRPMERSAMGVTQSGVPVDTLRENWQAMQQDLRAKLAAITPPLNTQASWAHPDLGALNSMEWLVLSYLHNHRHHEQIERVKSAPGFPK